MDNNFEITFQGEKKWDLEYKHKNLNSEEYFKAGLKEGVDIVSQPPTVETRGLAEITTLFPRSGC